MNRIFSPLAASILALMLQVPGTSFACSPAVVSASYFVQHAPTDGVGFSGTVVSVVQEQPSELGTPLIVTVKTKKWFLGHPHEEMKIQGFTTSSNANDPCHGVFDFHPAVGAGVVIFGQVVNGVVSRRAGILEPLPPTRFSYK
jgi:hypothetical protein